MSQFIKVETLNFNNIEADTTARIRASEIVDVREATVLDKKHRQEANALIILRTGNMIAVTQTAEQVVEAIDEASL